MASEEDVIVPAESTSDENNDVILPSPQPRTQSKSSDNIEPSNTENGAAIKLEAGDGSETLGTTSSSLSIKSEDDEPAIKQEDDEEPLMKEEDGDDTSIKHEEDDASDDLLDNMADDNEIKEELQDENICKLEERHMSPEEDRMEYEKEAETKSEKADIVLEACKRADRDELQRLARSEHGLVSEEIRQIAWPVLLGYTTKTTAKPSKPWRDLSPHRDEEQVRLDVNRSFVYYPLDPSPSELENWRKDLFDLIAAVLRHHPMLCYFQGFHDIAQVVLLVLGPERAVTALEYISLLRIRDYMLPSLSPALQHLALLQPILHLADEKLSRHLSSTQPFFALAAMLTLYAHDIQTYSDAARLFDVFLAEEPIFPVYFFAVIVLQRRDELFDIPEEEPEMLHHVLSKLPKPLQLDLYIEKAIALREKYPPQKLGANWKDVSKYSVLKTFNYEKSKPTPEAEALRLGEAYFGLQSRELDRQKLKQDVLNRVYKLSEHKLMIGTVVVGVGAVALGLYMGAGRGSSGQLRYDDLGKKLWSGLGGIGWTGGIL